MPEPSELFAQSGSVSRTRPAKRETVDLFLAGGPLGPLGVLTACGLGWMALFPKGHSALAAIAPGTVRAGGRTRGVLVDSSGKSSCDWGFVSSAILLVRVGRETLCGECFTPCLVGFSPPFHAPVKRAVRLNLYFLPATARLVVQLEPGVSSYSARCSNLGGAMPQNVA